MARAWFSYVVFAIGMMMLVASDKQSIADNKQESENVFTFADTKDVHVFVNKMGDDDAKVDVMINGKKHTFTIPELLSGQTKNLTTEDGTEITVKALEGKQVVFIGDEQINIPGALEHRVVGKEGLSSIITRVHEVSDFAKDTVTISGAGLSEDAKKAMVDAVQGVLVSYGIDKEVMFRKSPKFEFIQSDGKVIDLSTDLDLMKGKGNFDIKVEASADGKEVDNIVVLKKQIEVVEEEKK